MHDCNHPHEGKRPAHDGHTHARAPGNGEEAVAYLKYTLRHQTHHAEELAGLCQQLEELGYGEAAQEMRRCADDLERANRRLQTALALLKG